jgi:phasin family protein
VDAVNHDQEPTMATEPIKAEGNNPFTQTVAQATRMTDDFTRLVSEMKLPAAPDMEVLLSLLKHNMETLSGINRIAADGAQAVAKRHMEIMQQSMLELSETVRSLAALTDTPQAKAAKQTELLKKAYERAISNTRELSDVIQRSGSEAMELLNHRFTEAMDEVKSLVEKAAQSKS